MSSCCNSKKSCCDEATSVSAASMRVALLGNPNCGKTTLFNLLTGARQHVGNWPGVTVERKSGLFTVDGQTVEVVDLPGTYSLTLASEAAAIDECIACDFVLNQQADVIVNIVDASNLERHLYLTMQLIEMGAPMVVALNMMDVARARKIHVNKLKLAQELGCPVIAIEANRGIGIGELKRAILAFDQSRAVKKTMPYPAMVQATVKEVAKNLQTMLLNPEDKRRESSGIHDNSEALAVRLLEDDIHTRNLVSSGLLQQVAHCQSAIKHALGKEVDLVIAETRYRFIDALLKACLSRTAIEKPSWTTRIDHIVLNRFLGIPIFLAMMYLLFVFAINIGGLFQDFFDISSQTIFVDGFAHLLNHLGAPTWLIVLLANGVGKGINTTITFIPVIGAMFLFLAFLEDSGYMARAAFVVDRLMRALGLPGKAFVPMIVGFGCNVPAVMAARTLENKRDRILTIMMSPFMSCGARLAIYAVFTSAFFPRGGQNVVFALYLIGVVMAIFTGFLLQRTVLKGNPSPLIMELPTYHVPQVKTLGLHAWQRLKGFVFRAGKLIVPICVLIGALNTLNVDGTMNGGNGSAHSLLSIVGQWMTPIFEPMGIHADNWPATVGLVTGVLAKEVVVGTLNTLYTQMGHFAPAGTGSFHFFAGLQAAWQSIPNNIAQLSSAMSNPILASAPAQSVNQDVYGLMYKKFDGQVGAFAYLLFVLLYFPCISTMAVMLRELDRRWTLFSACWMTGVAYGMAVIFYQAATWEQHPLASSLWVIGLVMAFGVTVGVIRNAGRGVVVAV